MQKKLTKKEKIVVYSLLIFIGALLLSPFIYMVSIALASNETNFKMGFTLIPKEFNFDNFYNLFKDSRVPRWILNSIILVVFNVVGQVFMSSLVAYGFARMKYKHKNKIFIVLLATMMIPSQITMIPQFIIFRNLGWVNTLLPMMIPAFFGGAYNIFLMRQFIMRIPVTLDEAAKLDGLSYFGVFTKIIFPLVRPAAIAVGIFSFTWSWGAFMEPLIYINDTAKMPLALGVQLLSATDKAATPMFNLTMSAALLLTIPLVIAYFIGQKYLFEMNLSAGSSGDK